MAITYHQLGNIAHFRQKPDEAEDWYRKSLALTEEVHDLPAWSAPTTSSVSSRTPANGWRRPTNGHGSPLSSVKSSATAFTAGIYHQLGLIAQGRGLLGEAEECYRKSLVISEELSDRRAMAGTYSQLGMVAQGRGLLGEAEEWYRKSNAIDEGSATCQALPSHMGG